MQCRVCGGSDLRSLASYKHNWWACTACGNIRRERKERYPLQWLPLPRVLAKQFHPTASVRESEDEWYHYYSDVVAGKGVEQAKFEGEADDVVTELKAHGVDLAGKAVLDVSGGPGFVARDIARIARRSVVTEFSPIAAKAMGTMGIESVKYDFNSDKLDAVVSGPFDVIMVRYAVNFCEDLREFGRAAGRLLAPGGVLWIGFVPPTLGTCLRWQYDEYTYNNLYTERAMMDAMQVEGIGLPERYDHRTHSFWSNRTLAKNLVFLPFAAFYAMRDKFVRVPVPKELNQRNVAHIYRKPL